MLPDGTLVDVYLYFKGLGGPNQSLEGVQRSNDGGATWSKPIQITDNTVTRVVDPDTGTPLRTGSDIGGGLPDIAVDPQSGALYGVFEDNRFSGSAHNDIALSKSTDGGRTWSDPVKVNQTPGRATAFTPAVDVLPDGTVAVTYYDWRNNTPDPATLPTDEFIVVSHNGAASVRSRSARHPDLVRHRDRALRARLLPGRLRGTRQRRDRLQAVLRADQQRRYRQPHRLLRDDRDAVNSAPWGSAIRRTPGQDAPGSGSSRAPSPCVAAEPKRACGSSGSNRLAVERTARVSRWDNGLVFVVRPRIGLGLTAGAIAVAAAGVGITVAAAGDDTDSGIVGRVLCPVVLERSPGCSDLRVVVRERSSNRRVATVKPNRLGRFTVALEPGVYLIEVQPRPARAAPTAVRVLPHRFAHPVLAAWPTARPADARQLFQR